MKSTFSSFQKLEHSSQFETVLRNFAYRIEPNTSFPNPQSPKATKEWTDIDENDEKIGKYSHGNRVFLCGHVPPSWTMFETLMTAGDACFDQPMHSTLPFRSKVDMMNAERQSRREVVVLAASRVSCCGAQLLSVEASESAHYPNAEPLTASWTRSLSPRCCQWMKGHDPSS